MKTMVDESVLMDYASGALPEPVSLAVATHLSLHGAAAQTYSRMNALGGVLLQSLDGEDMSDGALDSLLTRLDDPEAPIACRPGLDEETCTLVPAPLRDYLPASLEALDWKKKAGGVEEVRLPTTAEGYRVSLLRIRPGQAMPMHSHKGCEYTVVLDGAYHDEAGTFERGDFCHADARDQHSPVADDIAGCLCLIVLDQPVRLSGPLGWMVNPFLKN